MSINQLLQIYIAHISLVFTLIDVGFGFQNAGNTGGLFDATGKISVRSSGGVPMKPQETTKKVFF
jgi:hypothetical protein